MTLDRRNRRSLAGLAGVVAFMGAAAWASVPLYDWFCRVTGFDGSPLTADSTAGETLDQTVTIRFDASLESGMPWNFRPAAREIEVRLGESVLAYYEAHNPGTKPVAGSASYNVYPFTAGGYFVKIDCFCFEEQVLQPGETVSMPVNFYVDPDIVNDPEASSAAAITLSYTFHRIALPAEERSAAAPFEARSRQTESFRDI